jgi:hypothetical protein
MSEQQMSWPRSGSPPPKHTPDIDRRVNPPIPRSSNDTEPPTNTCPALAKAQPPYPPYPPPSFTSQSRKIHSANKQPKSGLSLPRCPASRPALCTNRRTGIIRQAADASAAPISRSKTSKRMSSLSPRLGTTQRQLQGDVRLRVPRPICYLLARPSIALEMRLLSVCVLVYLCH